MKIETRKTKFNFLLFRQNATRRHLISYQKCFWFYGMARLFHPVLADTIKYVWQKWKIPPPPRNHTCSLSGVRNRRSNRGASNDEGLRVGKMKSCNISRFQCRPLRIDDLFVYLIVSAFSVVTKLVRSRSIAIELNKSA